MRDSPDPALWVPSTSPWLAIRPHFGFCCSPPELEELFGGIRDFIFIAAESPALANRYVHPSTINMVIFEVADIVAYSDSYRHRRFIVSPHGRRGVRLKYVQAQETKPVIRCETPSPAGAGRVRLSVATHVEGLPEPEVIWDVIPADAINIIARHWPLEGPRT